MSHSHGSTEQLSGLVTRPREKERFPEEDILDLYRARAADADVVLDLPSGSDGSTTALLLAEHVLPPGRTVMYLTDNARQALALAAKFPGLRAAAFLSGQQNSMDELVAYYNAQALGISDVATYFSARSVTAPADLVVFDSHVLSSDLIDALCTLREDRSAQPGAYDGLCELLLTRASGHGVLERIRRRETDVTAAPFPLPSPVWSGIADGAAQLLTAALHDEDARFLWPRLQPWLHDCRVTIGPTGIEICPPRHLIRSLPGYRYAGQRVHLSTQTAVAQRLRATAPAAEPASLPPAPGRTAAAASPGPGPAAACDLSLDDIDVSASIRHAVAFLRENYADGDVTLSRVAQRVYMSQWHFSRSFKEQTGWRFINFVTALRLHQAQRLLRETSTSITGISRMVGYRELSHFQRMFKKQFGMSASAYRARHQSVPQHDRAPAHERGEDSPATQQTAAGRPSETGGHGAQHPRRLHSGRCQ